MLSIESVRNVLYKSWSLESSSKWTRENPAKGQCGVTALVVNDLFVKVPVKSIMVTKDVWFRCKNLYMSLLKNIVTKRRKS